MESLALSPDGTRLFAGGHFGTAVLDFSLCNGSWGHGLISVDPNTGAYLCDWIPQMTTNALFVGGYFTSISGVAQSGVAQFTLNGSPPPPPSAPTITSFSPSTGPPGTTVTVTGTGFLGTTKVSFGSTQAQGFTVNSDTQLTTTVPVGALTGPIKVTTVNGIATAGSSFHPTISITSFAPPTGPVGTSVVLTGVGFTVATGVLFGSIAASSHSIDSDTQITAVVPAGAVTAPIKVSTSKNGSATTSTSFKVTG